MTRADLRQLADDRVADAAALPAAGRWSAAYYLAGYAVECGLKACVAKRVAAGDFPDKQLALDSYTHDVGKLVRAALLTAALDAREKADRAFSDQWTRVADWDESSRYARRSAADARGLFDAVTNPQTGVLTWIKGYW